MSSEAPPFELLTLEFGAGSLVPVPRGKWKRLASGRIEATYTPLEWEWARAVYNEVVMPVELEKARAAARAGRRKRRG